MSTPLQYLKLSGVEIANADRTLTYLRRGIVTGWDPAYAETLIAEGPGYVDCYEEPLGLLCGTDGYTVDPFTAENLLCHCALFGTEPYIDPATDRAPWYTPDRPESADFLGVLIGEIDMGEVISREVQSRGSGGGSVGPLVAKERTITVHGVMVAASASGMAWGERWLIRTLSGKRSGQRVPYPNYAGLDSLRMLLECGDDRSWRTLGHVGLISTPLYSAISDRVPACDLQNVEFSLVAGNPYLARDPEDVIAETGFQCDDCFCAVIEPDYGMESAARITIAAGEFGRSVDNVRISWHFLSGDSCPVHDPQDSHQATDPDYDLPGEGMDLGRVYVQRGTTLVIDGHEEIIQAYDSYTGKPIRGQEGLEYDGSFRWPRTDAHRDPYLTNLCICVDGRGADVRLNHGTRLKVEKLDREV